MTLPVDNDGGERWIIGGAVAAESVGIDVS